MEKSKEERYKELKSKPFTEMTEQEYLEYLRLNQELGK